MENKQRVVFKVLVIFIMCFAQRPVVAEEIFHAIVAQDGSGHYTTISAAVAAAPSNSPTRYNIKIKAGVYKEYVEVGQDKQNLAFIGEGIDVTIITGNRSDKDGFGIYESATVVVKGSNFIAKYITINNSAGPHAGQAVALQVSANYAAFYKCKIDAYQDTLLVDSGYQFFRESTISGTVDFIFGSAPVVLQKCEINVHNRPEGTTAVTAQSKDKDTIGNSGISIHNCTIKGAPDFKPSRIPSTVLGRAWRDHATVVYMESYLDGIIDPVGWSTMSGKGVSTAAFVFYGEYNNSGPGANMGGRVTWAKPGNLTLDQAQKFTVRNFINGNDWLPSTGIPYTLDLINN